MATDKLQLAEEFMTGFVTEALANGVPPEGLPRLLKRANEVATCAQFPEEYAAGYAAMMKEAQSGVARALSSGAGEFDLLREAARRTRGLRIDPAALAAAQADAARAAKAVAQAAPSDVLPAVASYGAAPLRAQRAARAQPAQRALAKLRAPTAGGAPTVAQSARAGSRWKWPVLGAAGLLGTGVALGTGPGHEAASDIRDWYDNLVYGRDPVVGDLRQQLKQLYESRDPRMMAMAPTLLRHRLNQALGAYLAQFPGTVYKPSERVPSWTVSPS